MKTSNNSRISSLKAVMNLAWSFIKKNGFTKSEALKAAWANIKLKARMAAGIVKFAFTKVDGTIREAYGTLAENLVPPTQGTGRRPNDSVQVYWDTEKEAFRCFKKANLIAIR
jgi:hypothetical protein